MKKRLFVIGSLCFLVSCNKSPFERTKDASKGGATGSFSGTTNFVIFNNELVSGGGAFVYPGEEGQTLSFQDRSNPISQRSIRYHWTGEAVSHIGCPDHPTHNFAGFDLMYTTVLADYNQLPARDLRQAGYTRATFYARGSLSTNTILKVEVASAGTPAGMCSGDVSPCVLLSPDGIAGDINSPTCTKGVLTSSWQSYTIPIANSDLAEVRDFFKATFIFADPPIPLPGQGGTVYFDSILYQP